jgi:biuret amidohydrolase
MSTNPSSKADAVSEYTVPFDLAKGRPALVVIDMQYASACRTAGFGAWLTRSGRAEEGDYRFTRVEESVVPNIRRLLDYFRTNGLQRVFVRLGSKQADYADILPQLRALEAAFQNRSGNQEFEFLEEIAPLPGEPVITKLSVSAFTSSGIDALLRNLGVDTLVFCGVSTSQCVDLTARDAADRGYRCLIVEDAVAEDTEGFHRSTLEQFARMFGRVGSASEVMNELSGTLHVDGTSVSRRAQV